MSALIPNRGNGLTSINFDEYTDFGTNSKEDISEMEYNEQRKQTELQQEEAALVQQRQDVEKEKEQIRKQLERLE